MAGVAGRPGPLAARPARRPTRRLAVVRNGSAIRHGHRSPGRRPPSARGRAARGADPLFQRLGPHHRATAPCRRPGRLAATPRAAARRPARRHLAVVGAYPLPSASPATDRSRSHSAPSPCSPGRRRTCACPACSTRPSVARWCGACSASRASAPPPGSTCPPPFAAAPRPACPSCASSAVATSARSGSGSTPACAPARPSPSPTRWSGIWNVPGCGCAGRPSPPSRTRSASPPASAPRPWTSAPPPIRPWSQSSPTAAPWPPPWTGRTATRPPSCSASCASCAPGRACAWWTSPARSWTSRR